MESLAAVTALSVPRCFAPLICTSIGVPGAMPCTTDQSSLLANAGTAATRQTARSRQDVPIDLSLRCFGLHLLAVRLGVPPGLHQLIDGLRELSQIILLVSVKRIH